MPIGSHLCQVVQVPGSHRGRKRPAWKRSNNGMGRDGWSHEAHCPILSTVVTWNPPMVVLGVRADGFIVPATEMNSNSSPGLSTDSNERGPPRRGTVDDWKTTQLQVQYCNMSHGASDTGTGVPVCNTNRTWCWWFCLRWLGQCSCSQLTLLENCTHGQEKFSQKDPGFEDGEKSLQIYALTQETKMLLSTEWLAQEKEVLGQDRSSTGKNAFKIRGCCDRTLPVLDHGSDPEQVHC